MTLDHLFVLLRAAEIGDAARELADDVAASLESAGFRQSVPRRHVGQGTENRRFRFDGFMVELLFLVARDEAEAPRTAPLSLLARHDAPGASPFGFASRPTDARSPDAPYPHVAYRPAYLPDDASIAVAEGVPSTEPLWFHLPPALLGGPRDVPLPHPNGLRRLDAVTLAAPSPLGVRSREIAGSLGLSLRDGADDHHLTLRFDDGARGERLVPDERLPVTIEC